MRQKSITIYVDADACPVKKEIDKLAVEHGAEAVFVASYSHFSSDKYKGKLITVDAEPEAADLYIVNHAKKNDVVITHDNGLAAMLLHNGTKVISFRGKEWKNEDTDALLLGRLQGIQAKKQKKMRLKGPPPFSQSDRNNFTETLSRILKE
ncbi:DUF188 domain-containing protein [Thalassorhabdus alkalitolerans]|uniref:UPF0178 protein ACFPU1_11535 n=1 Tax=Thalassorhabdus alkalitolerans TaxID=2282697 RepID=A0ABW0YMN2_9BACI